MLASSMHVHHIIKSKGSSVVTLPPAATLAQLLELMDDHKIGSVVIVDDDARVVGLVTERDVIHAFRTGHDQGSPASEVMSEYLSVTREDDVDHLAATMTERRMRHLPVIEDGMLVGLVSIGDVVKARQDSLEAERDRLDEYIRGIR